MPSARIASGLEDHVRYFNVAVEELRSLPSGGGGEAEKILQVLTKFSDLGSLSSSIQLLLDLQWILESQDRKMSLVWSAVNFLTRLCSCNPGLRRLLRDRMDFMSTLTNLLVSLPSTTHNRTGKLLELIKYVVHGIKLQGFETFLQKLTSSLFKFIVDEDKDLIGSSLAILTCLCQRNYSVSRSISAYIDEKKLKYLFVKSHTDSRVKVLTHFLNNCLNLADASFDVREAEGCMARISDAFCAAYADNDVVQLEMFTDFLQYLASDPKLKQVIKNNDTLSIVKQIILLADFSEGCNTGCNESMFAFFRQALCFHSDPVTELDFVVRALELRLKGGTFQLRSREAVLLLNDVVSEFSSLGDTPMKNMKLQVEGLIPILLEVLQIDHPKRNEEEVFGTVSAILETFRTVARLERELLLTFIKNPNKFIEDLQSTYLSVSSLSSCYTPITVELVLLYLSLENEEWTKASQNFLRGEKILANLTYCLKKTCHPSAIRKILRVLGTSLPQSENQFDEFIALMSTASEKEREIPSVLKSSNEERIEAAMSSLSLAIQKSEVRDENLIDVLQLGNFRLSMNKQRQEILQKSLEVAEERLTLEKQLNLQLELENNKLSALLEKMYDEVRQGKLELMEVRNRYDESQSTATTFRTEMIENLEQKNELVKQLEREQEKLSARMLKYKETNESLQETIKEHQAVQTELKEKLKAEKKVNAEMAMAFEKREEKLRKKERQLDEEMTQKERLEKDLEVLKKEFSSLKTLAKRQEQALSQKDKQLQEQADELNSVKMIQEQIFNLTKLANKNESSN